MGLIGSMFGEMARRLLGCDFPMQAAMLYAMRLSRHTTFWVIA